jgi:hypothetical protein
MKYEGKEAKGKERGRNRSGEIYHEINEIVNMDLTIAPASSVEGWATR